MATINREVLKSRPGFWAATFIERLANSSEAEIVRRREKALKIRASTAQGQADIDLAIRLMDEELRAR